MIVIKTPHGAGSAYDEYESVESALNSVSWCVGLKIFTEDHTAKDEFKKLILEREKERDRVQFEYMQKKYGW